MKVLHRRDDGTFVIEHNGYPYHVTHDDAMYAEASAAAEGIEFPPEPLPQEVVLPSPPQPTRAQLFTKLQQLQAQIEALPEGAA